MKRSVCLPSCSCDTAGAVAFRARASQAADEEAASIFVTKMPPDRATGG